MSEIGQLRAELAQIREEMQAGFEELREWKRNADKGMKGDAEYGLWGYQQKIDHNRDKIETAFEQIDIMKTRLNRIIAYGLGGASVAGTLGGIIVWVIQLWMGG